MDITHALLTFTIAAGLLTITPGLDTALVLRTAAVESPKSAMLAGSGICLGVLTWGFAVSVGLGAILAVSHLAYNALRIAGAGYLIYLGAGMLFRSRSSMLEAEAAQSPQAVNIRGSKNRSQWFLRGLLTNLLNPKVGVFYVTFLPQFIPSGVSVMSFSMLLATIHAIEGMLWFWLLTHATQIFSTWLRRPAVTRTLDRATGTVLVGFGLELVFSKQK